MKILQRMILTWVVVMVTTIATIPNAHASDPAAVVIIATGDFYAVNTQLKKRSLKRRSKVYVGEKLVTGKNGRGQVRFIDGAVLSLRPETELKIHKYSYGKDKAVEGSWMSLLKGGFRTITGAIAKKKYKLTTSMATIGIRGTHYEAVINNEQLYVALWDGGVTLSNSAGSVDLGLGADYNYGMVQGDSIEPQGQIDPPAAIVNDNEPDIVPDLSQSSEGDSVATVDQPIIVKDIAQTDLATIMPTSGTATYIANTIATPTVGSVSGAGSTDSINNFNYTATVDFAAATIAGSMSFGTVNGIDTHDWNIAFSGGPSTGNGVNGTNFSMTGTGLMDGSSTASANINGTFTGANAANMEGDFTVSSGTVTEQGSFTATQ